MDIDEKSKLKIIFYIFVIKSFLHCCQHSVTMTISDYEETKPFELSGEAVGSILLLVKNLENMLVIKKDEPKSDNDLELDIDEEFRYLKERLELLCLKILKKDGILLKHIEIQTLGMCLTAVRQNGMSLQYVKDQIPELCIEAVKQNGSALEHAKVQDDKLCLLAVEQNPDALQFVKDNRSSKNCPGNRSLPSREIYLTAAKKDGLTLQYAPGLMLCKYNEEIFLEAARQNGLSLQHILDRGDGEIVSDFPEFTPLTDEELNNIYLEAIKQNGLSLEFVPKEAQTKEICLTAIHQNDDAVMFVNLKK